MTTSEPRPAARRGPVSPLAVGGMLAVAVWAIYSSLVLLGLVSSRAAFDAEAYHLAVIRAFAETWPAANVGDYLSATTPGYHWLLAGVWQVWPSQTVLEIVGAGVAGLLVGLLGWWSARESRWSWGWLAALPVMTSAYVVHAGIAVLPDNAAWLCVLGMLLLSLTNPSGLRWIAVGVVVLALVLVRQSHVWAVGVVVAAGWLGAAGTLLPGRNAPSAKLRRAAVGTASVAPALAALAIFVWIWGGLVPPAFAGQAGSEHPNVRASLSPVAPAYILMLIGLYAPFFAGWWWMAIRCRVRMAIGFGLAGGLVGLALSLVGASTFDIETGRNGGYWQIIRAAPVIGGRTSIAMVLLSAWGGAMVGVCGAALPTQRRWLLLIVLVGFASAQVVNANTWQRYYEPFVLMLIAVASACCLRDENETEGSVDRSEIPISPAVRLWRAAGPVLLSIGLAGLTATTLDAGG